MSGEDPTIELARDAAAAFCREFDFAPDELAELEREPPVLGPVSLERDGRAVTAYRWLGGGRGSDYVQAEVDDETGRVVVHGARDDSQYGPWSVGF